MRKWDFYTAKELKPTGWLRRQLEIQAKGLSGNLDKVWYHIKESAWIGGKAKGWERMPYWLDGFVPLAYLLEDKELINRAKKHIDYIINAQRPDGWICPCPEEEIPEYDAWPVLLIGKVLTVYYECSGDERIPEVIYKVMKNYYELLTAGTVKLFRWAAYRWFEGLIPLNFLYEKYKEDWIVSFARILKESGANYTEMTELWKHPKNEWTLQTHIVNLGMMLKAEAVSCDILGEAYTNQAEDLYQVLNLYNGMPVGTFTGDECLSGLSPIQGTELCGVAEQMYSYEHLFAYMGDKKWAERLELLAFNALPATISDDMWTHQYLQMSNQIHCIKFNYKSHFRTSSKESHLFGLAPHFGCCTANFNQAWPKFALSAFMHKDDTVLSAIPVPTALKTEDWSVSLKTNYPFENKFIYNVEAKRPFTLKVRIPSFAENVTVDGKQVYGPEVAFEIGTGEAREISICFDTQAALIDRPYNLKTVKFGSLIFSLPIQYEKVMHEYTEDDVERKFPYCDYEYVGKTDWNYGYSDHKLQVERKELSNIPFSSEKPPVVIRAKMKKINWGLEPGYETVCAKLPLSTLPISDEETVELYPYGCAKLRMTELPMV